MSVREPESRPRPIGCAGCHRRGERLTLFVNGKSYCANCAVLVREGLHIDPANPKALKELQDAAERATAANAAKAEPGPAAKNGTANAAASPEPSAAAEPTGTPAEVPSGEDTGGASNSGTTDKTIEDELKAVTTVVETEEKPDPEPAAVEPTATTDGDEPSPTTDAVDDLDAPAETDAPPTETEQNEAEPEAPAAQAEPSAPEQQEETVPEQASAEAPRRVRASARASESLIAALSEERERLVGRRAALEAKIQDIEEQIEGIGARLGHVEVLLAEENGASEAAA